MAREPPAVRTGHDPILATVQEQDWRVYLPRIKPPRADVCEVVIHHPAQTASYGLPGDGGQPGPRTPQRGMIGWGELFRVELCGREVVLQRRAPADRGAQVRRAGGRHAPEPVQPLGVEWSQPGHADRGEDALWQ